MIKGSIFTYEEMLLIVQQCPSAKACGTWDEARANAKRNANGLSRWQASNMSLDEQGRTAEKSERAIKAQETMDRNAQTVRWAKEEVEAAKIVIQDRFDSCTK